MIDITRKSTTLRTASAQAIVKMSRPETIEAVMNNTVPKGNVFEMAKTAGLFAVKRTHDMIPDCHPLPVEFASVTYEVKGLDIVILVTVKTIYKTGVEVEAMHGASIVALTIYDMLKPIDKQIEIESIRLIQKTGGKSDFLRSGVSVSAIVVVISDAIMKGQKANKVGDLVLEKMNSFGVTVAETTIIPDEAVVIEETVNTYCRQGIPLLLLVGGTGLTPRDITSDVLKGMIHREVPGIAEAMRQYGQQRTPFAFISRSMAGYIDKTLVIALPGSVGGASESIDAVFPHVLHVFNPPPKK